MSIKENLNKIEKIKQDLEKEIEDLIQERILDFQKNHQIAISDIMIFNSQLYQDFEDRNNVKIPKFLFVDSVSISLDTERYLLANIEQEIVK